MASAHPLVFDRRRQRTHRMRAAALGPSTFLIERVAEDLSDRLATVLRRFEYALDLGTPTDAVRRVLAASGKVGAIIAADALAGDPAVSRHWARQTVATAEREQERTSERTLDAQLLVAADEEALPFRDASLDLVVSALALQFVNDLPGTLIQIRRALKPDALLLAALVGGESLSELREAIATAEIESEGGVSPHVAPFADVRELGTLQQRAEFADVGKWSNVRRNSTFDLDLGSCDGLAQLRQTFAADKRRQQQGIRLQCATNLDQGSWQVVDKLQGQCRHHQIDRRVGKWQLLLVRCNTQEWTVSVERVNARSDNRSNFPTCCKNRAHCIGRGAQIDCDVELTQDSRKTLSQFGRSAIEQKSCRAKLARTRLPRSEKLSVKYAGAWRHCLVR